MSTLSFACPSGDCGDKDCDHHKAKGKKAAALKHDHEEHSEQFMLKPERPAKTKKPTPPAGSVDSEKAKAE